MSALQVKISNPELSRKGKVVLIKEFLASCSRKTTYEFIIASNEIVISPTFRSQDTFDRVQSGILEILGNMCEEMDERGRGCETNYNCCDCGGNNCGCGYCFPCNACHHCLSDE